VNHLKIKRNETGDLIRLYLKGNVSIQDALVILHHEMIVSGFEMIVSSFETIISKPETKNPSRRD